MDVVLIIVGIVFLLWLGINIGRASNNPNVRVDYDGQYNRANQEGYMRGRLKIKDGMTLEALVLVLHRNEGLLQAVRDNVTDIKKVVQTYGTQDANDKTNT